MINDLIPKSRVNITYDMEVNGVKKAKELAFKQLILADLSNGKSVDRKTNLGFRDVHDVSGANLDSIMSKMDIDYTAKIPNRVNPEAGMLEVNFKVNSIKSFNPNTIAENIPELAKLIKMKELLKEYGAIIDNNRKLRNLVNNLPNMTDDLNNIKNSLPTSEVESYRLVSKDKGDI